MATSGIPTTRMAVDLEVARLARLQGSGGGAGGPWTDVILECLARHGVRKCRLGVAVWFRGGGSCLHEAEPTGSMPPSDAGGTAVNVTIREGGGPGASVVVEAFAGTVLHGFVAGSPARAVVKGGHLFETFMYRGRDVTALVAGPVHHLSCADDARLDIFSRAIFPDRRHQAVMQSVLLAERCRDLIVLSPGSLPGLHAVRLAGTDMYRLADDAEADALLARGGSAIHVRHDAHEATLIRKVGGLVHGPTLTRPGLVHSRLFGGLPLVRRMFYSRGAVVPEPTPEPADEAISAFLASSG